MAQDKQCALDDLSKEIEKTIEKVHWRTSTMEEKLDKLQVYIKEFLERKKLVKERL